VVQAAKINSSMPVVVSRVMCGSFSGPAEPLADFISEKPVNPEEP